MLSISTEERVNKYITIPHRLLGCTYPDKYYAQRLFSYHYNPSTYLRVITLSTANHNDDGGLVLKRLLLDFSFQSVL